MPTVKYDPKKAGLTQDKICFRFSTGIVCFNSGETFVDDDLASLLQKDPNFLANSDTLVLTDVTEAKTEPTATPTVLDPLTNKDLEDGIPPIE